MTEMTFITVRNEVVKVMFLHLSVILFTGGGLSTSVYAGIPHTLGSRHPLLGADPRGPGTPPPAGGYCCGWYTSYWNAFLFIIPSNQHYKSFLFPKSSAKISIVKMGRLATCDVIRKFLMDEKRLISLNINHLQQ